MATLHDLTLRCTIGALCTALAMAPAAAQDNYPSRPIRVIVPFSPGGAVDGPTRIVAQELTKRLNQQVVVENRPGAGGLIGTDFVAKQVADGYTLLVSHAAVHVYATATRRTMPFDAVGDFTHMGMLCEAPMVLVVSSGAPAA